MDRTRALDLRHRRILGLGIILSVVLHAAAFAVVRFAVPVASSPVRDLALVAPADPVGVWVEAARVVEITPPAAMLEPLAFDAGGEPGAGGPPPPPRSAAPLGGIDAAVSPAGQYTQQPLPVIDPLTNGRISPVAFGDLPEAVFEVTGADEEEHPVYVPGSIGQAKRNWLAGSGSGNGDSGNGPAIRIGLGGIGGGHCPLPGRGRPLPPIWKHEPVVAS